MPNDSISPIGYASEFNDFGSKSISSKDIAGSFVNTSTGISPMLMIQVVRNLSISPFHAVNITGIFTVEIISSTDRYDNKRWHIQIRIQDFGNVTVTSNYIQYSLNGTTYFTATSDTTDTNHNYTFPTSGSSTRIFSWNAFKDLGYGTFNNVKFRVSIFNGTINVSHEVTIPQIYFELGLGYYPPFPNNFKKYNIDDDPVPKVETSWTKINTSEIRNNFIALNSEKKIIARVSINENPAFITAHNRVVSGYNLYKDTSSSFTPPAQGTLVANEATLTQAVESHTDLTVSQGQNLFYKLGTVITE